MSGLMSRQGLLHGLHLCLNPCMTRHAPSLKATCMTAKFGSFFDYAEMDEKRQNVISSFILRPISFIFAVSWFKFC